MTTAHRFLPENRHGIHYAVSIFLATSLLWFLLEHLADTDPIWAISSMVATSDPLMKQAVATFRGRILNAIVGCATGLAFLVAGGDSAWKLPVALSATVLLSTYVVRIPTMWRQAPITAAIVIAAGLAQHSKLHGIEEGLKRVGEVMLGCVIGLVVAWLLSKLWPLPTDDTAKA